MFEFIFNYLQYFGERYQTCILSILSSILIGLIGILPVITIQLNDDKYSYNKRDNKKLNLLLSLAVGCLLGDVFLHLLPEAVQLSLRSTTCVHSAHLYNGILVLFGVFTFVVIEIISNINLKQTKEKTSNKMSLSEEKYEKQIKKYMKGFNANKKDVKIRAIETTGYLNLIANCFDNFSHGLAVSTSFMAGIKIGFLTTFTIIIHEIPHEFGDFAILLDSGFTKWEAMRAQLFTSSIGLLGAMFALCVDYINKANIEIWVLPFTCGAFINIALVGLVPQLLRETDIRQSIEQILMIGLGIGVMAVINGF